MKIINTDGMALLGPGSEWVWAMLQFGVLAATGYAIYRQLRAQHSANALHAQASLAGPWAPEKRLPYRCSVRVHCAGG